MLDGLKRKVAATVLGSVLKSLASSPDTRTSITGLIAGVVLAVPGLDLAKLIAGDPMQIAHLLAGLAVALIGYLATKPKADGKATLSGAIGGALFAAQGSVEAIVTGVVIAMLGYLTNKREASPK